MEYIISTEKYDNILIDTAWYLSFS